jgi:6-phosphogluconolactonase (cycloisomerase 2 family)
VTADGRFLLAANYTGGTVASFRLAADGAIAEQVDVVRHEGRGPDPDRQDGPHSHMVVLDDTQTLVSVVELGLDAIRSYRLDDARLHPVATTVLPPGSGPRQLVRSVDSGRAWVLAELAGRLLTLEESAPGRFEVTGDGPASGRFGDNQPAQLTLSADGRRAYVSNRGPNTVSVFAIDEMPPR